ncbi:GNAT family N-acetyltransferase [Phytomonospora sp. NPDC050363]|uniref:GNAT family N-acetyltransferase n=1 Tax=Phytomonospora sp. NPDC050363 TaxID=3155642 RepID=UPI0033DB5321
MEPVTLIADDITLRPAKDADFPALAAAMADRDIFRWTLVPANFGEIKWDDYLQTVRKQWRNDGVYRWFVVDTQSDELLGMVGFLVQRHETLEIVYWTTAAARGRGVTERACRVAIGWAFDAADARRVSWDAIIGNHFSRLLALKLGFTMTGKSRSALDQRGERVDLWTGELLPGELRDSPPPGYPVMRARALAFMEEQPVLSTSLPELTLRPMAERDLDGIVEACQDAEAIRWTTIPQPYFREHAEGFLDIVRRGWVEGVNAVWVLADGDDAYCGTIDLRLGENLRVAEVGYATAAWARGKGYMTAALKALTAYGFDVLGCERITWKAYVGNDASRRVAEKAGFTVEGVLRAEQSHRGEPRDCWLASRLRTDHLEEQK